VTRARRARLAAAAHAALALAASPLATSAQPAGLDAAPAPRCLVAAELDRTSAYVGEQLHYRVYIFRRTDATHGWATPLAFPRARAEWLVGFGERPRGVGDGQPRVALIEHRAVFPAHPGPLRIDGAAVRCASRDGAETVPVPAVEAAIEAPPEEGRPPGWRGLVGPVRWTATLTPERLALGGSARLSVTVLGTGNAWLAPSPRAQLEAVAEIEVFERPPQLARDAGRELVWRRYFTFELVPRREGRIALPALELPYFDPQQRAYAAAALALPPLDVGPARPAQAPAPRRTAREGAARPGGRAPLAGALLAVGAAGALLGFALARARRRRRAARPPPRSAADWLREARAAQARADAAGAAAAAERALRAALDAAPRGGAFARELEALLARVQRGRFAAGAALPALAEVEALVARAPRRGSGR